MNPSDPIHTALSNILQQGLDLLQHIDHATYTRKLPAAFNSSIGAHYRHCLDHFEILLTTDHTKGEICYDLRRRDARLENDRDFAQAATRQMVARVLALPQGWSETTVLAQSTLDPHSGASAEVGSSFGREAVYSITHAIHHYALIRVMCGLMDVALPEEFGVAPSTLQHQRATAAS